MLSKFKIMVFCLGKNLSHYSLHLKITKIIFKVTNMMKKSNKLIPEKDRSHSFFFISCRPFFCQINLWKWGRAFLVSFDLASRKSSSHVSRWHRRRVYAIYQQRLFKCIFSVTRPYYINLYKCLWKRSILRNFLCIEYIL